MLRGVVKRPSFLCGAALALCVAVTPAPARGDVTAEAQKLLAAGISHYANGEFHKAIALLNKAASLGPKPALLARVQAYLGVNYFVTNQRDMAQAAFTRALQHDPAIKLEVKEVGASILRLFEATRKGYQGSMRVAATRPNLLVTVDGQKMGKAPWEGKLPIGSHRLNLETEDGKWHCQRQVVLRINSTVQVTCKLQQYTGRLSLTTVPKDALALLGRGRSMGKAPLKAVTLPVGQHRLRIRLAGHQEQLVKFTVHKDRTTTLQVRLKRIPETPADRRRFKSLLAYTSLGVGLALLSGAAVLYGIGASEGGEAYDQYHDATKDSEYEGSRKGIESAREKLMVGHVLAGAALAAVGFSVYQFVTRPKVEAAPRPGQSALSISPAPGGAVFSLGGRF